MISSRHWPASEGCGPQAGMGDSDRSPLDAENRAVGVDHDES